MDRSNDRRLTKQLCEVIASLNNAEETALFLRDLCTEKEIEYMAQRVEAAILLMRGKTYQEVTEQISISSATLTRVSKCVKAKRGYFRVLGKRAKQASEEEKA